ncbi:MAG TPA: cupredoxin domain-containing protein [Alphaproteobacteria bacterium]|nr:cupredoxin domain-containing protein [Alphaproteobacteria bacterium]
MPSIRLRLGRPLFGAALAFSAGLLITGLPHPVAAAGDSYDLAIKDHKFVPDVLEVPAGRKVKLVVKNQDATPEEFDSDQLHREKVITGGKEGVIYIGPLDPGTYEFIGEYHAATAKGRIIAK